MADERTPRPKISVGEKDEERRDDAAQERPADDGRYTVADAVRDGAGRLSAWVSRTFPGHERAFWGAVAGFVAAIAFLVVGPWPLVVIAVFVLSGVAVGQALDGDPRIVNTLRRLFTRGNQ